MARDPQSALVALNRFGLGARGASSGDFVNAASDPRGFVKAELARRSGALLEGAGLLPTAVLAQEMFAYQAEVKLAREAAAKSRAAMPPPEANSPQFAKEALKDTAKPDMRNLPMNVGAADTAAATMAMNGAPPVSILGSATKNERTIFRFQSANARAVFFTSVQTARKVFRASEKFGAPSRASLVAARITTASSIRGLNYGS